MILNLLLFCILLSTTKLTSCNHPIFCNQSILQAIANSNIFKDSKQFVDLTLNMPVSNALTIFDEKTIEQFVSECFGSADEIFETIDLPDFNFNPPTLLKISNIQLRKFAMDLNIRWNQLARKVNLSKIYNNTKNTCDNLELCSSFLPQIDGRVIIVPGGRFKQAYYWDSYWIIKGLLVCDMIDTAADLVRNFFILLNKYGFIPNGFRQYYLNRSQPPFLGLMVKEIVQAYDLSGQMDKADQFQKQSLAPLLIEHQYWMQTHVKNIQIKGKLFKVNIYNSTSWNPRAQSFRQDSQLVQGLQPEEKRIIWHNLNSMAQSGWDFSSRWLKNSSDLTSSFIDEIIPSDLNTIMGLVENYLATLCSKLSHQQESKYFKNLYLSRKEYFIQIHTQEYSRFPDSHMNGQPHLSIYPSDYWPYIILQQHSKQLPFYELINPASSMINSTQQWDYPNVWAPNNWAFHEISVNPVSYKFANNWVSTVYCSWNKNGFIYEKYSCNQLGKRGQGGQYIVQTGFGWTNGLVLWYFKLYLNNLEVSQCN